MQAGCFESRRRGIVRQWLYDFRISGGGFLTRNGWELARSGSRSHPSIARHVSSSSTMSFGERSLLADSFDRWAGDSPTCPSPSGLFPSCPRRPLRRRLPSLPAGMPSSASTDTSSDSASSSSIYSDSSSSAWSFIGPSLCSSSLPCLSRQFPDLAFSRATALASSPTHPPLPRSLPCPLVAVFPAAFRGCRPLALSSACSRKTLCPAVMTGKRRRPSHPDREVGSAAPSPSRAPEGLAPVLLRAAAALVEHEGAGKPARHREPIYRSPCGRTHPHLRARGGSFRRRRPPRPAPAVQREIVGPLQPPPPSFLRLGASSVLSPAVSLQLSQQLSSGVAVPPLSLSPAPPAVSAPLPAPPPSSSPPLAPPPLSSSAGAPLVSHPSSPLPSASPPPVEPPQRQHPLVPSRPVPEARFPPPRARSPELPPDAPDLEDGERWWNGELWESPP
ncbi:unnamed protein product [Closterium sp. Naga37s-1]|nr:unnamed protein product [Closterium sp. Naga37s-1]